MGTNFYLGDHHLGKRSAAGWYCWDCKRTLCAHGEKYVHYTKLPPNEEELQRDRERLRAHPGLSPSGFPTARENEWMRRDVKWHDKCSKCGKPPRQESIDEGAVGRELGFNRKPTKKKGVTSCCSFSWAMPKSEALLLSKKRTKENQVLRDEYGREYSHKEFLEVLSECPIEFTDMIGTQFS